MKKILGIAGATLLLVGMAAGDSITMDGTTIVGMVAPIIMIMAGAGIMLMTKEGKR